MYKNGQAGVTKATVTITFDNTDKSQSPLGYDHYNEVSITRQVKKTISQIFIILELFACFPVTIC